jgi:GntR family transcriptional regulator
MDQIKQAIRMNLLVADEQLPSVRVLASALQINPMTISKAFSQLEIEGILIRKRGVGMLVAEVQKNDIISSSLELPLQKYIENARKENLTNDQIMALMQQYLSIQSQEKPK